MLSRTRVEHACDAYLAAVLEGDGVATADLFAPDGTVEDPIGAPVRRGHDVIAAFYGVPRDIRSVRRIGPVTVCGDTGAFQFAITLVPSTPFPGVEPGTSVSIVVTDILTFDDRGRILRMVGVPDAHADPDATR